jgi:mannose-1-phosphate guanylyltransferase/mannose-1-phosphate guanylyltransferase/mannose-6-phosphate isomerase
MEGSTHYQKDERPWGLYERFTLNEPSTVKIITVNPHQALSLQTHEHREEFWHIVSGSARVTIGNSVFDATLGSNFFIPKHTAHRIETADNSCVFLEIAYGEFDENDITRIEDKYGRT